MRTYKASDATTIVSWIKSEYLNELNLDMVWCGYYDGNLKSKRVCEKSGFRFHHTNADIFSPLGDKRTEHFYSMSKEDFHALHID